MSIEIKNIEEHKSLLSRRWKLKDFNERDVVYLSQKFNLKYIIAKLLSIRGVDNDSVQKFINPNIKDDIPNPGKLKDIDINEQKKIDDTLIDLDNTVQKKNLVLMQF